MKLLNVLATEAGKPSEHLPMHVMKESPEGVCKQPRNEKNHQPHINAKSFTKCTNFPSMVPVVPWAPAGKIWSGTCAWPYRAGSKHSAAPPPGIAVVSYLVLAQLLKRELRWKYKKNSITLLDPAFKLERGSRGPFDTLENSTKVQKQE